LLLLLLLLLLPFCAGASSPTCSLPRALLLDLGQELEAIRDLLLGVRHWQLLPVCVL